MRATSLQQKTISKEKALSWRGKIRAFVAISGDRFTVRVGPSIGCYSVQIPRNIEIFRPFFPSIATPVHRFCCQSVRQPNLFEPHSKTATTNIQH